MASAETVSLTLVIPSDLSTGDEYLWLQEAIRNVGPNLSLDVSIQIQVGGVWGEQSVGLFWHDGDPDAVDRIKKLAGPLLHTRPERSKLMALVKVQDEDPSSPVLLEARNRFRKSCKALGLDLAEVFVDSYSTSVAFHSRVYDLIENWFRQFSGAEQRTDKESDAERKEGSASGQPGLSEESIVVGGVSDHVAKVDTLGFKPYYRAVAMFLRHKRTTPPFTMSIDGEWGCGKSSFMRQLQYELENPETLTDQATWVNGKPNLPVGWKKPITIWFNPWRHDKDESLWAAFALTCLRQIPKHLGTRGRQVAYWRRMWRRLRKPGAFEGVLKTVVKYVVAAAACVALFVYGDDWAAMLATGDKDQIDFITKTFGGTAIGAALLAAVRLWKIVEPVVKEPIASDLAKHLQAPDYASRVAYLEQFHEEFSESITDLVPDRDVFVFIDDLDRCEVPRAAELMQAINLLTAGDAPLYFIIGMDREKVAAGVAAKHKPILEHLDGLKGLDFGYSFIQKFIQLPFRVPKPTGDQLEKMLHTVVGGVEAQYPTGGTRKNGTAQAGGTESRLASAGRRTDASTGGASEQEVPVATVRQRVVQIKDFERDSDKIKRLIRLVAPFLDHNPRRVKQFAGLFRLQYYLAVETGLCDIDVEKPEARTLSIEQVGKFVALAYLWPRVVERLEESPYLLTAWERHAIGREALAPDEIKQVPSEVIEFLRIGLFSHTEHGSVLDGPEEMYLEGVNVLRLLRVATPIAWEFVSTDKAVSVKVTVNDSIGIGATANATVTIRTNQVIEPESIESGESVGEPNIRQQSESPEDEPRSMS